MLTLTEPQVWVLIGVFAAAIFGMFGVVLTSINRTLTASIGGVRAEIVGLRDAMNARFEAVDVKFEMLERDIQALSRHVFGSDPR